MQVSTDDTGRFIYKVPKKGWFYREDVPPNVDTANLLNPDKFIPHYLERKDHVYDLPPLAVEIHPTAICNYNCSHCSYANRNKCNEQLPQDIMVRLMQSLTKLRVKAVYFSGGGEPTLYPDWDIYIRELIDKNIQCALITNGSMLSDNPILSKLNYIAISVYSTYRDIFTKVTGRSDDTLFQKQFDVPDASCIKGARCVVTDHNRDHIKDIKQTCLISGYDYFLEVPYVNYETVPVPKEYVIGDGCWPVKLMSTAFINYDGEVYLCQPHIGNKEYSIGNIIDTPLEYLWINRSRHEEVINKLVTNFQQGKCANCRAIAYNRVVQEYEDTEPNVPITIIKDNFI